MRASLLALLLLAAPAFGQADDYFQRVDLDGDGRVSLEEFLERMGFAFRQMDVDGNGVLEPHEQHEARFGAQFRRQDANGDGYLSSQELLAPPRR